MEAAIEVFFTGQMAFLKDQDLPRKEFMCGRRANRARISRDDVLV